MPKRNKEKPKSETLSAEKSVHDDYDLPDELDFSRLRFVGVGVDALRRHVDAKKRPTRAVELQPDVAEAFPDEESVNEALRAVMHAAERLGRRHPSGEPAGPQKASA